MAGEVAPTPSEAPASPPLERGEEGGAKAGQELEKSDLHRDI